MMTGHIVYDLAYHAGKNWIRESTEKAARRSAQELLRSMTQVERAEAEKQWTMGYNDGFHAAK